MNRSAVREAFESLRNTARVRWLEKEGAFEVRCRGRASDPCTEPSVRFLEAIVRESPDVRLISNEEESETLQALGCRLLSKRTWELTPGVDVRRLRSDVLYLGHYSITAGDPSITEATLTGAGLAERRGYEGLAARTTITLLLTGFADNDVWHVWFRSEA